MIASNQQRLRMYLPQDLLVDPFWDCSRLKFLAMWRGLVRLPPCGPLVMDRSGGLSAMPSDAARSSTSSPAATLATPTSTRFFAADDIDAGAMTAHGADSSQALSPGSGVGSVSVTAPVVPAARPHTRL
jgi:hypothetical protein